MRKLAVEEMDCLRKIQTGFKERINNAEVYGELSKNQMKKLLADVHNEWYAYKQRNKIEEVFGLVFTRLETPIEGSLETK